MTDNQRYWCIDSDVRKHLKNMEHDGVALNPDEILLNNIVFYRCNTQRIRCLTLDRKILAQEDMHDWCRIHDGILYEYYVSKGFLGVYGICAQDEEMTIKYSCIPDNIQEEIVPRISDRTISINEISPITLDDHTYKIDHITQLEIPEKPIYYTHDKYMLQVPNHEAYRCANQALVVFNEDREIRPYFDESRRKVLMLFCELYTMLKEMNKK